MYFMQIINFFEIRSLEDVFGAVSFYGTYSTRVTRVENNKQIDA